MLADIEKTIKEAHRESRAVKRKHRDENSIISVGELSMVLAKFNDNTSEGSGLGTAKLGCLEDGKAENYDGSGMAEAGVQPRRPQ